MPAVKAATHDVPKALFALWEHDTSDGGDGKLQSHRYAHVQQSLYVVFVQGGFSLFHFQDVEFPEHIIQAKQGGDGLREDRGDGGSGHAPM